MKKTVNLHHESDIFQKKITFLMNDFYQQQNNENILNSKIYEA